MTSMPDITSQPPDPVERLAALPDESVSCRWVVPAGDWDSAVNREAIWARLRDACADKAELEGVTLSGEPGEQVSQYIRLYRENGELYCDTGANDWTATDVWLQLTVKVKPRIAQ